MIRRLFSCLLLSCLYAAAVAGVVKVACVGNSITYGFGLSDPATESYPAQLQQMLGDGYEVGNFGKSGATLLRRGHRPYNEQEEYRRALEFAGDIVVIHLGVNDTDPRNWPNYRDEFVSDYLSLIDSLRSVSPECRVIIARLTPIRSSHARFESGTRDWRDEIQEAIAVVAQAADAELIDFSEPLYAYPYLMPDAIHPTKEGARRLAAVVYSAITGDYGGLQMPAVYTDHMVLQRDRPLVISGQADAGVDVTVSIAGQMQTVRTSNTGKWQVCLPALSAPGPYTLTVTDGSSRLSFSDVLVGEVWLCSGQSNMEFMLKQALDASRDVPAATNPDIRLFDLKARWRTDAVKWDSSALDSVNRLLYFAQTRWQPVSPSTVADFSAVAYYFGAMLYDSLRVPIGLICNAVGGSPIEAWIDRSTVEHQFPALLDDWLKNDFIQDWVRGRAKLNISGASDAMQRHPYEPCYLYEAGIAPLEAFPLRGVIWYQGESNAHNKDAHSKLFRMLVDSWRRTWDDPHMPFYYVQLSSIDRPSWPWFRDSQRLLMQSVPDVAMVVSSDKGDSLNVHPRDKKPIGERLARWALADTYGYDIVPSGPLFGSARFVGDTVYVDFDYADGLHASDGSDLRTFELASLEGLYSPAVAEVVGNSLKVWSPDVESPRYLRYGWQPFTRANLVNSDGLPASTFRAEAPRSWVGDVSVEPMEDSPSGDKNYAKGVSALYSGFVGGGLIVAGGANFPAVPAADGGSKRYYDDIYLSSVGADTILSWKRVGRLPQPAAYGVSLQMPDGLICIGGMNSEGSLSSAYILRVVGGKPETEYLPSLPVSIDNMAGCVIGNVIYVAGGNVDGSPSNRLFCLDLDNNDKGWTELEPFPGEPRVQPVCAAALTASGEQAMYLWGGFASRGEGRDASLSLAGYAYIPATGEWRQLPAPVDESGEEISLGGGCALAICDSLIVCMGGVDKDIFLAALSHTDSDYMLHEPEWYRFNKCLFAYNTRQNAWQVLCRSARLARAGASLVSNGNSMFVIGGELKPGVRTTSITRLEYR